MTPESTLAHVRSDASAASALRTWGARLALPVLVAAVLAAHVVDLAEVPRGLYIDESSIGLNAALVAESGHDEKGRFLPLYFEAFGEYKNPIYVYVVAAIFRVAGPSVGGLRLASALFLALELLALVALVRALWPDRPSLVPFVVLAAGFLPHHFVTSRVAFEVISQPAFVLFALLCARRAFAPEPGPAAARWAAAGGLLMGLSIYTYSTGRLLAPLLVGLVGVTWLSRAHLKRLVVFGAAFGLALAPYFVFALRNPGALTRRFKEVSYLWRTDLDAGAKVVAFLDNYFDTFTARFLVLHGDANLRHTSGFGGIVQVSVLALALVAVVGVFAGAHPRQARERRLVLGALLLAPVGAALTSEGSPHALRTYLVGDFLVLLACFGLDDLVTAGTRRARAFVVAAFVLTAVEAGLYVRHFFGKYPAESARAFQSDGFEAALAHALQAQPTRLRMAADPYRYAHLAFYRRVLDAPPALVATDLSAPLEPGDCVLSFGARPRLTSPPPRRLTFREGAARVGVDCY